MTRTRLLCILWYPGSYLLERIENEFRKERKDNGNDNIKKSIHDHIILIAKKNLSMS